MAVRGSRSPSAVWGRRPLENLRYRPTPALAAQRLQRRQGHGQKTFAMSEGDSLLFQADVPHGPEKLLRRPVRYLSVLAFSAASGADCRRWHVNAWAAMGAGPVVKGFADVVSDARTSLPEGSIPA